MKSVITFLRFHITMGGLIFFCGNMFAQIIRPSSIVTFPDIHPDSLEIYKQDSIQFMRFQHQLDDGLLDFSNLSDSNQIIYDRGNIIVGGYYSTAPPDCSIYCIVRPEFKPCNNHQNLSHDNMYSYEKVHDFDLKTGQQFDIRKKGDTCLNIEMILPAGSMLSEIVVYNGFCIDLKTWKEHGRIKDFEVWMNNSLVGLFRLEDTWRGQKFPLKTEIVDHSYNLKLTLFIKSWYTTGPGNSVTLSEINFVGSGHAH